LEAEESEQSYLLLQLDREPAATIVLPSEAELRSLAEAALAEVMSDDQEAVRLLRQLIPDFIVVPYQICDGDAVVPRAYLTLNLAALLPPEVGALDLEQTLVRKLRVDLFDLPQRVRFREQILALKRQQVPHRQIARRLGLKQQAVLNALKLEARMRTLSLTDPYQLIVNPPAAGKLQRHRHSRYRFVPLPGFPWTPPQ
jgi:hypothetical protein